MVPAIETASAFKQLFEEARQHDDYWTEGLIVDFTEGRSVARRH